MYSRHIKLIAAIAGVCVLMALKQGAIAALKFFGSGQTGDQLFVSLSFFGTGLMFGGIAIHFARRERRGEQEYRDRSAQRLAEEAERRAAGILSGSNTSPFVLYLRPFALEKEIREWKGNVAGSKTFFLEGGYRNFDYFLQEHLSYRDIPLISIGCPNDQEGAGHVVATDSSWRERFHQLAERATTIVVVPGMQAGIKAEIRWLKVTGLLVNTVFFKPKGYPKAEWEKVKELYEKEDDILLPEYTSRQLSFKMYSSGRCHQLLTWRTVYRKSARKRGTDQMRALLTNQPMKDD